MSRYGKMLVSFLPRTRARTVSKIVLRLLHDLFSVGMTPLNEILGSKFAISGLSLTRIWTIWVEHLS